MPTHISEPTRIGAIASNKPRLIADYIGYDSSGTDQASIAQEWTTFNLPFVCPLITLRA